LIDVDLPGRKVWYVVALLSGITWFLSEDVKATVIIAFGLLFVSFIPHGRHYTLNNQPRELAGEAGLLESWIEYIGDYHGRNDEFCLLLGKILAFLPLIAACLMFDFPITAMVATFAPIGIVCAYKIGWLRKATVPTAYGEYATGLYVGLIIAAIHLEAIETTRVL